MEQMVYVNDRDHKTAIFKTAMHKIAMRQIPIIKTTISPIDYTKLFNVEDNLL